MNDLFLTMMEEMGRSLGFDFPKSQIRREGCITKPQADIETDFATIRKGLVEVLAGNTSIEIRATGGQSLGMAQAQNPQAVPSPAPHVLEPGEKL